MQVFSLWRLPSPPQRAPYSFCSAMSALAHASAYEEATRVRAHTKVIAAQFSRKVTVRVLALHFAAHIGDLSAPCWAILSISDFCDETAR